MRNLADRIEAYLLSLVRQAPEGVVELQRAELAEKFDCVPSQINYVLATRFSPERGFVVESRRGGGGYIRISRLNLDSSDELQQLVHRAMGDAMSQDVALAYITRLQEAGLLTPRETALMTAVVHREVLALDLPARDILRANLLRAMLLALLRFE
ncbi:MAG: CtsR family transcriptional regulator [Bacillota bacterium]